MTNNEEERVKNALILFVEDALDIHDRLIAAEILAKYF